MFTSILLVGSIPVVGSVKSTKTSTVFVSFHPIYVLPVDKVGPIGTPALSVSLILTYASISSPVAPFKK
jgi:hypothetical protein